MSEPAVRVKPDCICAPQYILELFLEKQREKGEPPSDAPAMVALGEDRGKYSETPAELKRAPVASFPEIR